MSAPLQRKAWAVVWAKEPEVIQYIAAARRAAAREHAIVKLQKLDLFHSRREVQARRAPQFDAVAASAPGAAPCTIGWHDAAADWRWGCCETKEVTT